MLPETVTPPPPWAACANSNLGRSLQISGFFVFSMDFSTVSRAGQPLGHHLAITLLKIYSQPLPEATQGVLLCVELCWQAACVPGISRWL